MRNISIIKNKAELAHLKVLQSFHQLLEDVEQELGREGREGAWLGGGLAPRSVLIPFTFLTLFQYCRHHPGSLPASAVAARDGGGVF